MINNKMRMAASYEPPTQDRVSSDAVLLMHLSKNSDDTSHNGHVITTINTPTFSTDGPLRDNGSVTLDSTDCFTTPAHDDFEFGNQPFIIDFWVKRTRQGIYESIAGNGDYGVSQKWEAYFYSSYKNLRFVWSFNGTTQEGGLTSDVEFEIGDWHYVQVIRNASNLIYMYVDGAKQNAVVNAGTTPFYPTITGEVMGIGCSAGDSNQSFDGDLSEFRIRKGIDGGIDGSDKRVEVPNLSTDSATVFLAHLSSNSNDSSYTPHTVGTNGTPVYSQSSPLKDSNGVYFNTSSNLTIPEHSDFNFAAQPFVVEFWIKRTNQATFESLIGVSSVGDQKWEAYFYSSYENLRFVWSFDGTNQEAGLTSNSGFGIGDWHYVQVVRTVAGIIYMYVDGKRQNQAVNVGATPFYSVANGDPLTIGKSNANPNFDGYFAEVRITKGIDRGLGVVSRSHVPLVAYN